MTAEQQAVSAKVGDTVVFTWSGTHDVQRFHDQAAYTACEFGGATELAASSLDDTYTYTAAEWGTFYFGSSIAVGDCNANPKLTLTVTGMFYMRVNSTSQLVVEACLGGFALGICT